MRSCKYTRLYELSEEDEWDDCDNVPSDDDCDNDVSANSMDIDGTKDMLPPEVRIYNVDMS